MSLTSIPPAPVFFTDDMRGISDSSIANLQGPAGKESETVGQMDRFEKISINHKRKDGFHDNLLSRFNVR